MATFSTTGLGHAIFTHLSRKRLLELVASEGRAILNSIIGDNIKINESTGRLQLVSLTTGEKHDVHAEGVPPAVVLNPDGES